MEYTVKKLIDLLSLSKVAINQYLKDVPYESKKIEDSTKPVKHYKYDDLPERYKTKLQDKGISLPAKRVAMGAYTYQSGVECAEWLLNSSSPPTAIFASNDQMAIGVMATAKKMGIDIPRELTVIGFDDSPQASRVWPALTTMDLHTREMSKKATQKLLALYDNDAKLAASIQTEFLPTFIQRQTTAAPNNQD